MPHARNMREAAFKLYDRHGNGWFSAREVSEEDFFYHGLLVAMRGSGFVISKVDPESGCLKWKVSDKVSYRFEMNTAR